MGLARFLQKSPDTDKPSAGSLDFRKPSKLRRSFMAWLLRRRNNEEPEEPEDVNVVDMPESPGSWGPKSPRGRPNAGATMPAQRDKQRVDPNRSSSSLPPAAPKIGSPPKTKSPPTKSKSIPVDATPAEPKPISSPDLTGKVDTIGEPATNHTLVDSFQVSVTGQNNKKLNADVLRPISTGLAPDGLRQWKDAVMERLKTEVPTWLPLKKMIHLERCFGFALIDDSPAVITEREDDNGHHLPKPETARKLIFQLFDTLRTLHGHVPPFIHGRLTTDCIGFDVKGNLKLKGLGFYRILEEELKKIEGSDIAQYIDSARYIAPEVLAGGEATMKSDVYSFGCVVLELLTGSPPFASVTDNGAVLNAVSNAESPLGKAPSSLDLHPLKAILERCWMVDPDDRPTMHEIEKELLKFK